MKKTILHSAPVLQVLLGEVTHHAMDLDLERTRHSRRLRRNSRTQMDPLRVVHFLRLPSLCHPRFIADPAALALSLGKRIRRMKEHLHEAKSVPLLQQRPRSQHHLL